MVLHCFSLFSLFFIVLHCFHGFHGVVLFSWFVKELVLKELDFKNISKNWISKSNVFGQAKHVIAKGRTLLSIFALLHFAGP